MTHDDAFNLLAKLQRTRKDAEGFWNRERIPTWESQDALERAQRREDYYLTFLDHKMKSSGLRRG
jgi:hypothetical protein